MLVGRVHGRVYTKVYADTVAHELLAIQRLPYLYRGFDVEEGYYYTAEGLERRPCVYFRMLVYGLANLGECR